MSFQAKLETKALKAKRPGFTDDRYNETAYFVENGEYGLMIHLHSMEKAAIRGAGDSDFAGQRR